MKQLFVFVLIPFMTFVIPQSLHGQENIAKGIVYLDTNENGVYDSNEKGIEGVKVSNGLDVVKTNNKGRYEIELPPQSVLFISKPAGYSVPLNEVQLPQFYYLHYPKGTPSVAEWKWPVIKPTGQIPEAINFALLEGKVPNTFKGMGFADPQTKTNEDLDMMRKDIIDELFGNPYDAKFGLVAGDIVHDNLGLYERHNRLMSQIGIPMWNVPGNHDLNLESPSYEFATQTFKKVFGPDYYSFDYGQVHFLALNNVGYKGKGKAYEGHIDSTQMKWIINDLKDVSPDKLIMIITHIPLITYSRQRTFPKYGNTVNFKELLGALKGFQYVYTISGHDTSNSWKVEVNHSHGWYGRPFIAHTLAEVRGNGWHGPRNERGVRAAMAADGNPNGYYLFHFEDNKVKPQFIPAQNETEGRLRVVLDPPLINPDKTESSQAIALDRGIQPDSMFVVVNFFDGGERDRVTISLDGKADVAMEYKERLDPYYVNQRENYKASDDAMPRASVSSHIWQFAIPRLDPGIHVAIIRAIDEFGFEDEEVFTFETIKSQ